METPMVTFTLKQLTDIQGSLVALLAAKLDVRTSYRLTKFSKKVKAELTDLEEARQKLVKEMGEMDPDRNDGNLRVKPALLQEFNERMEEIKKEEVEIPVMKVKLADIEKANMSVIDIANLDFMIEEPTQDSKE